MIGPYFDPEILSSADETRAALILGRYGSIYTPDLVIAPEGGDKPYLYRWHVVPRNECGCNVYLHVQVASDPERPLHDHPWDNQSVILSGAYYEVCRDLKAGPYGERWEEVVRRRAPGDVIQRFAEDAHRLILPPAAPYCMTLFSTGPVRRDWGFYGPDGWVPASAVVDTQNGVSTHKDPDHAEASH